jgi:hypothetical protein
MSSQPIKFKKELHDEAVLKEVNLKLFERSIPWHWMQDASQTGCIVFRNIPLKVSLVCLI